LEIEPLQLEPILSDLLNISQIEAKEIEEQKRINKDALEDALEE